MTEKEYKAKRKAAISDAENAICSCAFDLYREKSERKRHSLMWNLWRELGTLETYRQVGGRW